MTQKDKEKVINSDGEDMKEKNNNDVLIDWVHLPNGTKVELLWECLHDADLKLINSDLLTM